MPAATRFLPRLLFACALCCPATMLPAQILLPEIPALPGAAVAAEVQQPWQANRTPLAEAEVRMLLPVLQDLASLDPADIAWLHQNEGTLAQQASHPVAKRLAATLKQAGFRGWEQWYRTSYRVLRVFTVARDTAALQDFRRGMADARRQLDDPQFPAEYKTQLRATLATAYEPTAADLAAIQPHLPALNRLLDRIEALDEQSYAVDPSAEPPLEGEDD